MNDSIDTTSDIILPPNAGEVVFKSIRTTKRIYVPQGTHLRSQGNVEAQEGITCFGNLNAPSAKIDAAYLHIGGNIAARTINTMGSIRAKGRVSSSSGHIAVGGFLEAGDGISTGRSPYYKYNYIRVGLYIKSGRYLKAQGIIQAGSYISAKDYIASEASISAGSYIEAKNINCADRIFVGISSLTPQEIRAEILGGTVVNPHQPWENPL